MATVATINKVFKTSSTVINPSDISNFYAGGELRNEMVAGGDYWSPTSINKFNESVSVDNNTFITTGEPLKIIGFGFDDLAKSINEMYNIANTLNQAVNETRVVRITVTATSTTSNNVLYKSSNDYNVSDGLDNNKNNYSDVSGTTSRDDLAKAWNNRSDMFSLLKGNPIQVGLTLYDVLTNKEVSVETRLQGMAIGTVYSQFNNLAVKGVLSLANITKVTPATYVVAGLVSATFGELAEMALGLDNAFGIGGEYVSNGVYGESKGFLGLTTLGKQISSLFGNTETFDLTNLNGDVIGDYTVTGGLFDTNMYSTEMYGYIGTGFTLDEAIDVSRLATEMEFMNEFNLTNEQMDNFDNGMFSGLDQDMVNDLTDPDFGINAQLNYDGSGNDDGDSGLGYGGNPSGGFGNSGYGSDVGGFGGGM